MATYLPLVLPVLEAAVAAAVAYIAVHYGPALGLDPTVAAVIVAAASKWLPSQVTSATK